MPDLTLIISESAQPTFFQCLDNARLLIASPALDQRRVGASFFTCLDTILRLSRNTSIPARITSDFEPLSFGFSAGSFVGGFIYHGPENPASLSVQLTPTTGWQLHT